jgi:hypothetical protein
MFVHGSNLEQKEFHKDKYQDAESRQFLKEIRKSYEEWKSENTKLIGPYISINPDDQATIQKRTKLFNNYKNFLDQQKYAEKFDSRSNLHSTVLEEFMFYLFRDLVSSISTNALIGKSHTFKDIFFKPDSYNEMLIKPKALIEKKDHDFAIGVRIDTLMQCQGAKAKENHQWDLPAVAIECKTYLDKTMLQDASTAAEQLQHRNPHAIYIVVAEWLKLTESVNLKKFKIDQIYILRKQKNTDREYRYLNDYVKNPIYPDVIENLFTKVRDFLSVSWEGGINYGLQKGYLL